jgi:hypothetical protein
MVLAEPMERQVTSLDGRAKRQRLGPDFRAQLLGEMRGVKNGLSLSELAQKMRTDSDVVAYQLRVLRTENKVRLEGTRQLARWIAK